MLARTHLAFALGIATLPLYALSLVDKATLQGVEVSLYLSGVALGSLLPDIDEPNSTLGRQLPLLSSLIHRLFWASRGNPLFSLSLWSGSPRMGNSKLSGDCPRGGDWLVAWGVAPPHRRYAHQKWDSSLASLE